jgi:hypothetical protein
VSSADLIKILEEDEVQLRVVEGGRLTFDRAGVIINK